MTVRLSDTRQLSSTNPRNSFQRRPLTEPFSWSFRPPEAGRPSRRLAIELPVLPLSAPVGPNPDVKNGVKANCPASAVSPRRFSCIARIDAPVFTVWLLFTIVSVLM